MEHYLAPLFLPTKRAIPEERTKEVQTTQWYHFYQNGGYSALGLCDVELDGPIQLLSMSFYSRETMINLLQNLDETDS